MVVFLTKICIVIPVVDLGKLAVLPGELKVCLCLNPYMYKGLSLLAKTKKPEHNSPLTLCRTTEVYRQQLPTIRNQALKERKDSGGGA